MEVRRELGKNKTQDFLVGEAVFFAPTARWVGSQIPWQPGRVVLQTPWHPTHSEAGEGLPHIAGVPDCSSAPTTPGLFLKVYHGV